MVETNARVLAPGKDIALPVRYALVQGTTNTPELREKVCYRLRREHGLIAVPCQDKPGRLLIATDQPVLTRQMAVDEWNITLSDVEESALLTLTTPEGWRLLPELVERMVTDAIERRDDWWTFDSLRYWYEKKPFDSQEGIDALRRYAVSAIPVEGVGIAVAVDVGTAFLHKNRSPISSLQPLPRMNSIGGRRSSSDWRSGSQGSRALCFITTVKPHSSAILSA